MTTDTDTREVTVSVTVTEVEALALAQLMKRIGWAEWRNNSIDQDESEEMRDACERLRAELADAGFAPR